MCAMPAITDLHYPVNYAEAKGLLAKHGFTSQKSLNANEQENIVKHIRDCWDNAAIQKLLVDNNFLLSTINGFDGAINKIKQEVYWYRLDPAIREELNSEKESWKIKATGNFGQATNILKGIGTAVTSIFSGGVKDTFAKFVDTASKTAKTLKGMTESTVGGYKSTTIATIEQFNSAYKLGGDMGYCLALLQFDSKKLIDFTKRLTQKMYYSKIDKDIKGIFEKHIKDIKAKDISNSGIVEGVMNTAYATINFSGSTTVSILNDINKQYREGNFGKIIEDLRRFIGVDESEAVKMADEMNRIKLDKSSSSNPRVSVSSSYPDSYDQPSDSNSLRTVQPIRITPDSSVLSSSPEAQPLPPPPPPPPPPPGLMDPPKGYSPKSSKGKGDIEQPKSSDMGGIINSIKEGNFSLKKTPAPTPYKSLVTVNILDAQRKDLKKTSGPVPSFVRKELTVAESLEEKVRFISLAPIVNSKNPLDKLQKKVKKWAPVQTFYKGHPTGLAPIPSVINGQEKSMSAGAPSDSSSPKDMLSPEGSPPVKHTSPDGSYEEGVVGQVKVVKK